MPMAVPQVTESLFHDLALDVVIPAGAFPSIPADRDQKSLESWWEAVSAMPHRDTAFLDEKLSYAVTLTIPNSAIESTSPTPSSAITSDSDVPPPEVSALARQVQLTATASFLPPRERPAHSTVGSTASASLAAAVGNATGAAGDKRVSLPPVPPGQASHTAEPVPGESLATPRGVPSTAPDSEVYAGIEGVTVWEGTVECEEAVKPVLIRQEDGWMAVWRGEMPVGVFIRTAIANPVLALTASVTLRDGKPRRQASTINDAASTHSNNTMQTEEPDVEDAEEEIDMAKLEEIDLLGGLADDRLPASRLGPTLREDLSINYGNLTIPKSTPATTPTPRPWLLSSGQTLRKSHRKVLSLSPGLRVRMRTLFLPQLLPPGTADSGDDSADASERRIVLCVEVENGTEATDYAFEIETVTVDVGGKGAKATAELACQPNQSPSAALAPKSPIAPQTPSTSTGAPAASSSVFPLRVAALEQYNLLYAVTIASSPGGGERVKGDEHRPVSILLSCKPFQPGGEDVVYPTATFQTRWNCTLDLTMYYASLPPAPPAPPTHGAAPRHAQHRISKPAPPTPNAIAGDKRYSLASLLADSSLSVPPNRRYVSNPPRPPSLPSQTTGARVVSARGPPGSAHLPSDGHGLLVSVKLLPPDIASGVDAKGGDTTAGVAPILPLDTFSIEVFVHNRTDSVRRFRLGIPGREPLDARIRDIWSRRRRRTAEEASQGVDDQMLAALLAQYEAAAPALIPLETDVRCGPLLPGASLAARIRFLALRQGVHRIERLRLSGMGDEFDFLIQPVIEVVVA